MLAPRIFTENLFDDLFEDFPFRGLESVDRKLYGKHAGRDERDAEVYVRWR